MFNFIQKQLKNKKGFTLVELVVVIAILGILAAIAVPRFVNVTEDSKLKADRATARTIVSAINLAVAAGDLTIGDDSMTWKSGISPVNGVKEKYDSYIATLIAQEYLENVKGPQSSNTATFTVVVSSGQISITNGGTDENAVTFYPEP